MLFARTYGVYEYKVKELCICLLSFSEAPTSAGSLWFFGPLRFEMNGLELGADLRRTSALAVFSDI